MKFLINLQVVLFFIFCLFFGNLQAQGKRNTLYKIEYKSESGRFQKAFGYNLKAKETSLMFNNTQNQTLTKINIKGINGIYSSNKKNIGVGVFLGLVVGAATGYAVGTATEKDCPPTSGILLDPCEISKGYHTFGAMVGGGLIGGIIGGFSAPRRWKKINLSEVQANDE